MSSISGVSGLSNAWANAISQRTQMQAKMFDKVDANSSGGVDQTELSTMLSDISAKTGTTLDAEKLFTAMDSNTDGNLSSDELASGMQSFMPPPSTTMEFAQNRGGKSGADDLFAKVDANSDGSVDETEMKAFTDKIETKTGMDSPVSFATLDTDSNGKLTQTEFEAGKPGGPQDAQNASAAGGARGAGGPPPAGGPGGPGGAAGASESTTYDPLDTNQDGTVSELERLAGALKELVATSENSESAAKAADSILEFAKQIYEQIASGSSTTGGSTLSAIA
ncbi:MAG: XopAW family type III secretion system calcium-binding effector [Rhodoferax sp.]|nr:XopAW family type III secretion system calcium-binding effector [Rhodoferax sp.]